MKFDVLRSIGHNIAASLASGISPLAGVYETDGFREAALGPGGSVRVDFLTGAVAGGSGSEAFRKVAGRFAAALPGLCGRHGTSKAAFRRLDGLFLWEVRGRRFLVTVQDQGGRLAVDEYDEEGGRFKVLDPRGRPRRKRGRVEGGGT